MEHAALTPAEFELFRKMIYDQAGISLSDAKITMVSGRLAKRLKHHGVRSFGDYFKLVKGNVDGELQHAIDLLTTNETFFFREPKHFQYLRDKVVPQWDGGVRRVWSAASSSGEEAYTLSMMLAEHAPRAQWEVVGTDISTRVLEKARSGHYPMARAKDIPPEYLRKYCLRGVRSQEGTFLVCRELRDRVSFHHANLQQDLGNIGVFDVIFLRNVLIYFDLDTKRRVVGRMIRHLKPGGYLMVGHSESLNGINDSMLAQAPSVYRKPE